MLHLGSQGPTVRQLQRSLNARFEQLNVISDISVQVDGTFGLETLASVKYLQCIGGLPVNGEVEARTLAFLTRGVAGLETLALGSFGTGVLAVQQVILQMQVQVQILEDGRFGPLTARGVRSYQQKSALLVDGIVGPHTWGKIVRSRLKTHPCAALLPNPYAT